MNKNDSLAWMISSKEVGHQKTPTAQCDCACADMPILTQDKLEYVKDKYISIRKNPHVNIVPMSDRNYVAIGKDCNFMVMSYEAYVFYENFDCSKSSASLTFKDLNLVKKMLEGRLLLPQENVVNYTTNSPDELPVWLHITDRCNLRCDYCYLPHEKVDMSLDTAIFAIDAIIRATQFGGYRRVKLKISGGEPLLRFSFILKILDYANEQANIHNLELDSVILTNGTLLNAAKASIIRERNLRLMLSLDGIQKYNDCQRKYIGGKGTFNSIEQALDIIQGLDIPIDISVTVSGRTAAGLADLTRYLLKRKLFFGFNFYRENIFTRTHEDLQLETDAIINGLLSAFKSIEELLPNRNLLTSLADRANLSYPHKHTCSAGINYLVFTPQGKISQCQMQLDKAVASVYTINPLESIRTASTLKNLSVEEKEGCCNCEWKYWCAGGCPLETHQATGRYDIQSPNCAIYKVIFPEIIRLEAKRILKYVPTSLS